MDEAIWKGAAISVCIAIISWMTATAFKKPVMIHSLAGFIFKNLIVVYVGYICFRMGTYIGINNAKYAVYNHFKSEILIHHKYTSYISDIAKNYKVITDFTFILLTIFITLLLAIAYFIEHQILHGQPDSKEGNEPNKEEPQKKVE